MNNNKTEQWVTPLERSCRHFHWRWWMLHYLKQWASTQDIRRRDVGLIKCFISSGTSPNCSQVLPSYFRLLSGIDLAPQILGEAQNYVYIMGCQQANTEDLICWVLWWNSERWCWLQSCGLRLRCLLIKSTNALIISDLGDGKNSCLLSGILLCIRSIVLMLVL